MIQAAIFDLDGTVLDNELAYGKAFSDVLNTCGVTPESDIPHVQGIGVGPNWQLFIDKYHIETDKSIEDLVLMTQKQYLNYLDTVSVRQGFEEFAYALHALEIKTALATSNTAQMTNEIVSRFLLKRFFEAVVTIDDIESPKPAPDIFLKAAEILIVSPISCIVFEDSSAGVEAAKAANMKVIKIGGEIKDFSMVNISALENSVE